MCRYHQKIQHKRTQQALKRAGFYPRDNARIQPLRPVQKIPEQKIGLTDKRVITLTADEKKEIFHHYEKGYNDRRNI